jgi:hypothetical protein
LEEAVDLSSDRLLMNEYIYTYIWLVSHIEHTETVCKPCRIMLVASNSYKFVSSVNSKGKAFPLQAWAGPWGSRRMGLQNF